MKAIFFAIISMAIFYSSNGFTSCFEQLSDLLEQYETPIFQLSIVGEKQKNRFTRMISIAEDLNVLVEDAEAAARVSKQIAPFDDSRRVEVLSLLLEQMEAGKSEISLRLLAPKAVGKLTNQTPKCDGPNCFNATLSWFFPELGIKSTSDVELSKMLKDHFKRVEVGEELFFGDVLVFKTPQGELVHTSIYLNREFGWHKGASSELYSWNFENHFGIFEMYGRSSSLHAEVEVFRIISSQ